MYLCSMTGALIGDLAAWTFLNGREAGRDGLVSSEARLSEVGLGVLGMFDVVQNMKPNDEWKAIYKRLSMYCPAFGPEGFKGASWESRWMIPENVKRVMIIACAIVCGWFSKTHGMTSLWSDRFHGTKEDLYVARLSITIANLLDKQPKEEAVRSTSYILDWHNTHGTCPELMHKFYDGVSPLSYASLAWECFDRSTDFESAIRNALDCRQGNKHMLCALTGAFAQAMYGCNIEVPLAAKGNFSSVFDRISSFELERLSGR